LLLVGQMLELQSISLSRGTKTLFDDVSVSIFAGQKIGLVGANGSGKSSLFALIRQQITADKGEITRPKRLRIAHVKRMKGASLD